jgi:hypothetical protein
MTLNHRLIRFALTGNLIGILAAFVLMPLSIPLGALLDYQGKSGGFIMLPIFLLLLFTVLPFSVTVWLKKYLMTFNKKLSKAKIDKLRKKIFFISFLGVILSFTIGLGFGLFFLPGLLPAILLKSHFTASST